jgi:4-amino-4-deoxy-L-arabinose transferase-like glycosyltransferase
MAQKNWREFTVGDLRNSKIYVDRKKSEPHSSIVNTPAKSLSRCKNSMCWFLLLGITIRLLALNHPLLDAHLFRQTQTAVITKSMMQEPGWHVGGIVTWRGDLPARLVQELPIYNYLVWSVYKVIGNLDFSGKLVSVILWTLGFLVLQRIWLRCLTKEQAFWANLIFVTAPLSVFFGQAFMPEMLVQLLAFSFLLALLRYEEKPIHGRFVLAAAIGLLGMLVKGPEILHLYLIAAILLFKKEGIHAIKVPVYWAALIISALVLKGWSHVIDMSNEVYFPRWTAHSDLVNFIGKFISHVAPFGYFKILLYLTCFVLTPLGLLCALAGAWKLLRTRPWGVAAWWVWSVLFYFVFWSGPVARDQSYYNLPALGPCALLFGIGVSSLRTCEVVRRWSAAILILCIIPFLTAGSLYLFQQDRVILESTRWIREHTRPDDLILLKANHRKDAVDYPALAPFPYYAERRFWVYSRQNSSEENERALKTSKYALVTIPPRRVSWVDALRAMIKQETVVPEDITPVLNKAGFKPIYTNEDFIVYRRMTGTE